MTIASPHITHHNLQPVHFSPLVTPSPLLSSCPRSQAVRWLSSCISARSAISQMTTVFPSSPSGIYLVFLSIWNIHWFYIHTAINCWFHWHGCSSPWSNWVVDLCVVDDGDPMVMTRGGASLQCSAFHDNDHELPLHATIPAHSITDNVSSCLNQRNTSLSIKRKRINHLSCGNFKWVNM